MKKAIGVILILIGVLLAIILKMGPAKETKFLFTYGDWPLIIGALAILIPGLIIYNKNR
ncbi:hypothetical protein LZQ00_09340 [Sphingobacterium sp. SRCM116780]|uniref:hypothetical protein n=1 Tax=Sphingobacterium sp. SRCM116780 TaxID=2907623 RepID=UPI001F3D3C9C|nr:hypothetical protein [Sphingobacterium sp. SRCM116780]UIR54475.1 hypothetical protein LZQ00_09340 [Sphingobacterium sp. SRCM116780]